MLHASLQGKVSVNVGVDKIGHSTKFNEDTLTSTVFGLMSYLSGAEAWQFLSHAISGLPAFRVGRLTHIEFWPAWAPTGSNVLRTEPDAYLRFKMGDPEVCIDFIVETKRGPNSPQSVNQWCVQIESYYQTIDKEQSLKADEVFYLAVSGFAKGQKKYLDDYSKRKDQSHSVQVLTSEWTDFSNAARRMRDEKSDQTARLFGMMLNGLAHDGFVSRLFFKSLPSPQNCGFTSVHLSELIRKAEL
jgi:hypothetical protein